MELHECLQSLFESKKATLSSISRLSDINKGTLHRIVYGKQDVKFDELMKISNALGLSLGVRFCEEGLVELAFHKFALAQEAATLNDVVFFKLFIASYCIVAEV